MLHGVRIAVPEWMGWLILLAGLLRCTEPTDNYAPRLGSLDDQWVVAAEPLSVLVTATDPEDEALSFYIQGRPDTARFVALDDGQSALFSWTPDVWDTQSEGKVFEVEFVVEDPHGARDSRAILITVLPPWAPSFEIPSGMVLDLAQESHVEMLVSVKDDASARIELSLGAAPDGAYLEQTDRKEAYFFWRPSAEQIALKRFWTVSFLARCFATSTGGEPTIELSHELSIVLSNADFEGCPGEPPRMVHETPGDLHWEELESPDSGFPLVVEAFDRDSRVAGMVLHWEVEGDEPVSQTSPMVSVDGLTFKGVVPLMHPGLGTIVHYWFTAVDNDDPAGDECDQLARLPKEGAFALVAYGPGALDACLDDDAEPNDLFLDARIPDQEVLRDLRLCPGDEDFFLYEINEPLVVRIHAQSHPEDLEAQMFGASGEPLGEAFSGGGTVVVAPGDVSQDRLLVQLRASADRPVTYTLSGQSQASLCVTDSLEPNDFLDEAPVVSPGTTLGLTLCPGELDLFYVTVPMGQVLDARISFVHEAGDLDLYVFDEAGEELLGSSESVTDNESVLVSVEQTRKLLVVVAGYEYASNDYSLTIALPEASQVCIEDGFAPNQHPDEALMMPPWDYEGLTLCPDSQDWFAVGLNGGETLRVGLATPSVQSLQVELEMSNGLELACEQATSAEGVEWVCRVPGAGNVLIGVSGSLAVPLSYDLLLAVEEDWEGCEPDRFEPNGDLESAVALQGDAYTCMSLCPGDEDWFSFQGYPFQQIFVGLLPGSEQGLAELVLLGVDGATLSSSEVLNGEATLEAELSDVGTYHLVVRSLDAAAWLSYSLLWWRD